MLHFRLTPKERLLFYPGGSQTSLFISTAACNGSSAPCPLPQPTLWSNTGAHETYKAWDGVEESPATWDALVASPLNMSGQGHYTEDRISLYPGDPVNNGVCPSSNTVCFIDRGAIFVSDNMTVNYPGGSKLSYTMDVGLVSGWHVPVTQRTINTWPSSHWRHHVEATRP